LTCSVDPAIKISSDNVRFDLRGFTITGFGGTGILLSDANPNTHRLTGVRVRNGKLTGFGVAIDMYTDGAYIRQIDIFDQKQPTGHAIGIRARFGSGNVFTEDTLSNADYDLQFDVGGTILGNVVRGGSISLSMAGGYRIFFTSIYNGGIGIAASAGVIVEDCFLQNGSIGATALGSTGHIIRDNVLRGKDASIEMGQRAMYGLVEDNVVSGSMIEFINPFDPSSANTCFNTWLDNQFQTANKPCIH
jgi:hypothetical protein